MATVTTIISECIILDADKAKQVTQQTSTILEEETDLVSCSLNVNGSHGFLVFQIRNYTLEQYSNYKARSMELMQDTIQSFQFTHGRILGAVPEDLVSQFREDWSAVCPVSVFHSA